MATTKVIERKEALNSVKEFNAEVRSISGACKVICAFWGKAETAMKYVGINGKNRCTPQNIIALIADNLKEVQSDGTTKCYMWVKKFEKVTTKAKDGSKVVTKFKLYKGKKVYTWEKAEIKAWTVNTIFAVLEQSKANQGAMPEYSKELTAYHKAVAKAQSAKTENATKVESPKVETPKAKASDKAKAKTNATTKASAKAVAKASAKKSAKKVA
jgi:hypothetical protein